MSFCDALCEDTLSVFGAGASIPMNLKTTIVCTAPQTSDYHGPAVRLYQLVPVGEITIEEPLLCLILLRMEDSTRKQRGSTSKLLY